MAEHWVIKIGGSTFSTSEDSIFDFKQAEKIKTFFENLVNQGHKFVLVTGGGFIVRKYQKMMKEAGLADYDLHYAGTTGCNLNAVVMRGVFGDLAEEKVLSFSDFEKNEPISFSKPIQLAGAGFPGPSSDWDATYLAKFTGAQGVISLKDTGFVYTADPEKDPNATKVTSLTWDEYLSIIGNPELHTPGENYPVDPIASKFAKESGLKFKIVDGSNFENLEKAILDKDFEGSTIN